jgi:hypothetical protein
LQILYVKTNVPAIVVKKLESMKRTANSANRAANSAQFTRDFGFGLLLVVSCFLLPAYFLHLGGYAGPRI